MSNFDHKLALRCGTIPREGAAHCPNGGKFGRPHEVGGIARMAARASRPKK